MACVFMDLYSSIPNAYCAHADGPGLYQCSSGEPSLDAKVRRERQMLQGVLLRGEHAGCAWLRSLKLTKPGFDLSRWMQKNHKELLLSEYENASPAYQSIVKS